MTFYVLKPCQGKAAFEVLLKSNARIKFAECIPNLEENGYEVVDAGIMIVAKRNDIEISIYPSAKLLIKCVSKEKAKEEANAIYGLLGVSELL